MGSAGVNSSTSISITSTSNGVTERYDPGDGVGLRGGVVTIPRDSLVVATAPCAASASAQACDFPSRRYASATEQDPAFGSPPVQHYVP